MKQAPRMIRRKQKEELPSLTPGRVLIEAKEDWKTKLQPGRVVITTPIVDRTMNMTASVAKPKIKATTTTSKLTKPSSSFMSPVRRTRPVVECNSLEKSARPPLKPVPSAPVAFGSHIPFSSPISVKATTPMQKNCNSSKPPISFQSPSSGRVNSKMATPSNPRKRMDQAGVLTPLNKQI